MTTATRQPKTVSSYTHPGPITADRDGYDPDAQQPDAAAHVQYSWLLILLGRVEHIIDDLDALRRDILSRAEVRS